MLKQIHQLIDYHYEEMVEIRRHLHQYPEVSFQEFKTAKYIAEFYEQLQIPYETNIGGNGIIATLKGANPGKTVALRADFDALPIHDEKDVPYKSKIPGVMHACGHDGHTATLLILAKVMKKFQKELSGTILFLHQHAEEYAPGGAKPIIETGKLDHIDAVFGNHLWATTPLGKVETRKGVLMAGADRFEITIQGKGGHGAYPQETNDAVLIGAEVVTQIQNILSGKIDPLKTAVINGGKFDAETTFNVNTDKASLIGTVRYPEIAVQEHIIRDMEQIIKGICLANNATYTFNYLKGYPPVVKHPDETELVLEASKEIKEINYAIEIITQNSGVDFDYYLQDKPGAFFFTG